MNTKITFIILATALFITTSCDEKYEIKEYDNDYYYYEPLQTNFFAGDTDSSIYYNYEPDVEFSIQYMQDGYFEYSQAFDINEDGIDDFSIEVEGYRDSTKPKSNYWRTIYLNSIADYSIAANDIMVNVIEDNFSYSTSSSVTAALSYGDTLTNFHYYGYYYKRHQLIETGYEYKTNSFDTCCGLWHTWSEDRYIAFQKIDSISILGWMRFEFMEDSETIKLKDCAIRKFKTKKYQY